MAPLSCAALTFDLGVKYATPLRTVTNPFSSLSRLMFVLYQLAACGAHQRHNRFLEHEEAMRLHPFALQVER